MPGFRFAKPTALKILQGNPGNKPLNHDEPKPRVASALPPPPQHLTNYPLAVENWQVEGKVLVGVGILTDADWRVFASRCYLYSEMVSMMEDIRIKGRVVDVVTFSRNGSMTTRTVSNPMVKMLDTTIAEYRRTGNLLGLDPVSRGRLRVGNSKKEDKLGDFLRSD